MEVAAGEGSASVHGTQLPKNLPRGEFGSENEAFMGHFPAYSIFGNQSSNFYEKKC
jgi:hypothetical protein